MADQETANKVELYGAPITGGGSYIKYNGTLIANGDVMDFKISPNSAKVVFRADSDVDYTYELYSVGILGANRPACTRS